MGFSLAQLFAIGLTYLIFLFGSAYAAERGWLPRRLSRHPLTRVLSLGVFAGAICFYGMVGVAARHGSGYFLYFIGASAAFIVAPVLLAPLSRIAQTHKLGSLADVFAYRYPAPWVGGLIVVLLLLGMLPLVALQISAVSVTVHLLNQELSEDGLAMVFCLTMIVFAILFGARHLSTRNKHEGLVFALGLESLFKLVAFVGIALYAVYGVFGGVEALDQWLIDNQQPLQRAIVELSEGESRSMLLIFFAAAVAMPHVYHILLTENDDKQLLDASRWGLPLYLLILSACIPVIVWAAEYLGATSPPEYHALTVGLLGGNRLITILAFVGGLAAASGVLIVSTIALASMTVNHILLPFYRPIRGLNFYTALINTRRVLITAIILAAYGLNQMLANEQVLMSLGMVTFVAVLQFLPGLAGAFYWGRATKLGLVIGLGAGFSVWFATLFFPLVSDLVYSSVLTSSPLLYERRLYEPVEHTWHFAATLSLILNACGYVIGSLLTKPTAEELHAANDCLSDSLSRPYLGEVAAVSVAEIEQGLGASIGRNAATREVDLALAELKLERDEHRSHLLTAIRNRLESNLATLLGQTMAHRIVNRAIPLRPTQTGLDTVHTLESRLEVHHSPLTGITAELDSLRRYHRQILQDLPTAVCLINNNGQVLSWNGAMEQLTGISAATIIGSTLNTLPDGWRELIVDFAFSTATNEPRRELQREDERLILTLHKASISAIGDVVIVIDDLTDEHLLEQQLQHRERLASIGQFAAGVAHEVGNPITGIACLAQNLKIDSEQPEMIELADQILVQTQRISAILQSLVNFSRGSSSIFGTELLPVNLHQCTDEAIRLLSLNQDATQVRFINRCPDDLRVLGDPQRLAQVFVNVLTNARDASAPGAAIVIDGRNGGEEISITVTDQGHGIPSEDLKRMFDPFFTTKDPGKGTGLGLAIVNSIVEEHDGSIYAESDGDGQGTKIVLTLPALAP